MAESMKASYERFKSENRTEPLLELNLEMHRSYPGPFLAISPESDDVEWFLKVNKYMDYWYLKIHRSGQRGKPLYCICDIPEFAFYFEYYFAVGTYYILLIPEIRLEEGDPPVNISCKVSKRIDRCDLRSESLNSCVETVWWEFPKTPKEFKKETWRTGFCTLIKSHSGRTYPFEMVLYRSGKIYIEIQRPVPGDVHFWGEFQVEECTRDLTFDLILCKGDTRIFVANATQFTFLRNGDHQAFCCTLFVRANIPDDVTNLEIAPVKHRLYV